MAYRNIYVENPAKISSRNNQLLIETEQVHRVPIEDICSLLIENKRSSITTAALSILGESGVTVYFCDDKHLPCAIMTPFARHSRELAVLKTS